MDLWLHQQAHPHGGNEEQCQDDGNKTEEHNREQKIKEREGSVVTIRGVVGEDVLGLLSHVPQGPSNRDFIDLRWARRQRWSGIAPCTAKESGHASERASLPPSLHNQHFCRQVK